MNSLFKSIINGFKTTFDDAWNDFQHLFTDDVEPFLKASAALIERNGGSLLLKIAQDALPLFQEQKFGDVVTVILADIKAAGIATVQAEEQLAAATALQFAQNASAAVAATTASSASDSASGDPAAAPAKVSDGTGPDNGPEPDPNAASSDAAGAAGGEQEGSGDAQPAANASA